MPRPGGPFVREFYRCARGAVAVAGALRQVPATTTRSAPAPRGVPARWSPGEPARPRAVAARGRVAHLRTSMVTRVVALTGAPNASTILTVQSNTAWPVAVGRARSVKFAFCPAG